MASSSFNGCWTCRVRRKKCDKRFPICDGCATLHISCYHEQEKPEWMDGSTKQEEMVERLKQQVKEKAHLRRGERAAHNSNANTNNINNDNDNSSGHGVSISTAESINKESIVLLESTFSSQDPSIADSDLLESAAPTDSEAAAQRGFNCKLASQRTRATLGFGRSDTILLTFYLEHLLPFMFPFYQPSLLQGGKAWLLEMMISSPVIRQATLCQSSYFFSLAQGTVVKNDVAWEMALARAKDAFGVLRGALQIINDSGIEDHMHGAVRIMASIMQIQRFDVSVLSFNNCHAHINAALALFKQLINATGAVEPAAPLSSFNAVLNSLGPASWVLPAQSVQVPSAEQAAFHFSSALLIMDDIIASTVLQEQPKLYGYHYGLLTGVDGAEPPINLEATVGCQNWVMLHIGEISMLDAWKQQCKRAGNLDVMELVRRASHIKSTLEGHVARLESCPNIISPKHSGLLNVFSAEYGQQQSITPPCQIPLVTRVWAHAALIYLSVVVSGWQPASGEVRYHVGRVIELLSNQISPLELIRTMVWPFCIAGCLAEPSQELTLRRMAEALQPPSVFGTVRKAYEIMELVWNKRRAAEDISNCDFGTIFRSQGDLVLLV